MRICRNCHRNFNPSSRHKDCPKCRAEKQKTPCEKCGNLSHRYHKVCKDCFDQQGAANPNWRGGKTKHHGRYIMIRVPEHPRAPVNSGYVFEHILVMEDLLGRYLVDGETVHHLNGVRDDNRPENLELWCKPQPSGIRASDAISWAQDVLELYAPELLNGCNSESADDGIRTRESMPSRSTR